MTPTDRRPHRPWYPATVTVIAAVMATSVAGLLLGEQLPVRIPAWCWVTVASSGFLVAGCLSYSVCRDGPSGAVALGLLGCLLGDLLGPVSFPGVVWSFLAAHVLFITAWAQRGFVVRRLLWGLLGVGLAAACVASWLWPHVPRTDKWLVSGYIVVISTMVVAAGAVDTPRWLYTLIAGGLFFVSDIGVARGRFVAPGPENAWLCYPLYYTACLMIAIWPVVAGAGAAGVPLRDDGSRSAA